MKKRRMFVYKKNWAHSDKVGLNNSLSVLLHIHLYPSSHINEREKPNLEIRDTKYTLKKGVVHSCDASRIV